jgi:hypothetical protein
MNTFWYLNVLLPQVHLYRCYCVLFITDDSISLFLSSFSITQNNPTYSRWRQNDASCEITCYISYTVFIVLYHKAFLIITNKKVSSSFFKMKVNGVIMYVETFKMKVNGVIMYVETFKMKVNGVIMYVETFKTDLIVLICNIVCLLILTIVLSEIKENNSHYWYWCLSDITYVWSPLLILMSIWHNLLLVWSPLLILMSIWHNLLLVWSPL